MQDKESYNYDQDLKGWVDSNNKIENQFKEFTLLGNNVQFPTD